jgi:hypothetical protein
MVAVVVVAALHQRQLLVAGAADLLVLAGMPLAERAVLLVPTEALQAVLPLSALLRQISAGLAAEGPQQQVVLDQQAVLQSWARAAVGLAAGKQLRQHTALVVLAVSHGLLALMVQQAVQTWVWVHLQEVPLPLVLQEAAEVAAVRTQQRLSLALLEVFPEGVLVVVEHQSRLALLPLAVLVVLAL